MFGVPDVIEGYLVQPSGVVFHPLDPPTGACSEVAAVGVERRPARRLIGCAAVPGGVSSAAVAELGNMTNEDLVRAERVSGGVVW